MNCKKYAKSGIPEIDAAVAKNKSEFAQLKIWAVMAQDALEYAKIKLGKRKRPDIIDDVLGDVPKTILPESRICKVCGGVMHASKVLAPTQSKVVENENSGYQHVTDGPGAMLPCLKCESCGHSYLPNAQTIHPETKP